MCINTQWQGVNFFLCLNRLSYISVRAFCLLPSQQHQGEARRQKAQTET